MNRPLVARLVLLALLAFPVAAQADVVVLANRGLQHVALSVWSTDQEGNALAAAPRTAVIAPGELAAIPCVGLTQMAFRTDDQEGAYLLDANCAYFFAPNDEGVVELQKIGLGGDERTFSGTGVVHSEQLDKVVEIPVKLLVDDDERAARRYWEARLRQRIDAASDILEKHCRVRFKVAAIEAWDSDDSQNQFPESMREFEREVNPEPARLAIGFTSQYGERAPGAHLGGTRGPLHPYILIREASQGMSEAERLEVLLHELGHYLGAVHSPERDSAMRPQLGDQQARATRFRIGFDPVNALALNLFADELRARGVADVGGLSAATRFRLQQIYSALDKVMPNDPAPRQYLSLIMGGKLLEPQVAVQDKQLAEATRQIVEAVVQAAEKNQQLPTLAQVQAAELAKQQEAAQQSATESAPAAETPADPLLPPPPEAAAPITRAEAAPAKAPGGSNLGDLLFDTPAGEPAPTSDQPELGPALTDEPEPAQPAPAPTTPETAPLDFLPPPPTKDAAAEPAAVVPTQAVRREGDALTSYYVREAAQAALELPPEHAASAFVLAVGLALDDSDILIKNPQTREFCQSVEPQAQRQRRIAALGSPTLEGRRDLAQHFFVSAFLTEFAGAAAADAAGLSKEMIDSTTGSGFSFADLAADKAGIAFADAVARKRLPLDRVAEQFQAGDYMPAVDGLPEGLSTNDFLQQIGSDDDARYQQLVAEIQRRIESLPGYQGLPLR